ncbi:MAG: sulfotransferase family 2 domain-containing protein [Verrucomicrobiota bacterium]
MLSLRKKGQLIWFQHLQKCAGSTIVKVAINNGERLCQNHGNGNPLTRDGRVIPLWTFSRSELTEFIDHTISDGVTFVACEEGSPTFDVLFEDERVYTITSLRDPYERLVSAYNFVSKRRRHPARSLLEYIRSEDKLWSFENYYTRLFSGVGMKETAVDQEDFERAVNTLNTFDAVSHVGKSGWLEQLRAECGWSKSLAKKANTARHYRGSRYIAWQMLRGDFWPLVTRFTKLEKGSDAKRRVLSVLFEHDIKLVSFAYDLTKCR